MTTKLNRTLDSLKIVRILDENPDLSDIGIYSDKPGENAIDRQERGDMKHGDFRYCNITNSGEETGNPDSVEQDYQTLEAFNRGEWCEYCIKVRATIKIPVAHNEGSYRLMAIESTGLWGCSSENPESYFRDVAEDQLAEILPELTDLGIEESVLMEALKDAKISEENY